MVAMNYQDVIEKAINEWGGGALDARSGCIAVCSALQEAGYRIVELEILLSAMQALGQDMDRNGSSEE